MQRPRSRPIILAAVLAASAIGAAASAHHGFTGRYDTTRPVWLQGNVTRATFQYPHALLTLRLAPRGERPERPASADFLSASPAVDPALRGRSVTLEFPPISRFNSLNGRIRAGDSVRVVAFRNCLAPHQLRVQWIRLADGSDVARSGRVQTEVAGCQ